MKSTNYPVTRASVEFSVPGGMGHLSITSDKYLSVEEIKSAVSSYFSNPNFHVDHFVWSEKD